MRGWREEGAIFKFKWWGEGGGIESVARWGTFMRLGLTVERGLALPVADQMSLLVTCHDGNVTVASWQRHSNVTATSWPRHGHVVDACVRARTRLVGVLSRIWVHLGQAGDRVGFFLLGELLADDQCAVGTLLVSHTSALWWQWRWRRRRRWW